MKHSRLNLGKQCFGMVLAGMVVLFTTTAFAQEFQNVLEPNAEIALSDVKVGAARCVPMLAVNTTDTAITISGLNFTSGSAYFSISDTGHFPKRLSSGQTLVLGNVCFTSTAPNREFVGYITIKTNRQGLTSSSEIRVDALTEVDSSLITPCLSASFDVASFGPVFYGGRELHTMTVTNNLDTTRKIRDIQFTIGDSSAFTSINNIFPLEIPAHSSRPITVAFKPVTPARDGSNNFRSKVKIRPMDAMDSCSPDYDIYGTAINPTNMNTMNPFDRTSILPVLAMTGTDTTFGQTFLFASTDKDSLLINSIGLDSQYLNFTVEPMNACSHLPMIAAPGDYMAVRLSLTGATGFMYKNKLRFVLGRGLQPIVYDVAAMRLPPEDQVSEGKPASSFSFTTIPNPSSGNITIQIPGEDKADIEIFDMSGKLVSAQRNVLDWTWDGRAKDGGRVATGTYLIRATKRTSSGTTAVESKQVALIR